MYPQSELDRLAAHKAGLRRSIAVRRAHCAMAAAEVSRPFEWLDRAVAMVRRITPFARFAALPLGFLAQRLLFRRKKFVGSIFRWAPLIIGAVRGIGAVVGNRASSNGRR